jgi:hypothetical protein
MKDIIRMNQLAGLITEGQAKKMMEVLNEDKIEEVTPNTSKLYNKFWGDFESAKEINKRIKDMDDNELLKIYNNEPVSDKLNSPRKIQVALIKKEIDRRGLNIKD